MEEEMKAKKTSALIREYVSLRQRAQTQWLSLTESMRDEALRDEIDARIPPRTSTESSSHG